MGGDHGHHKFPKIPDWRSYKVDDCPELVRTQRALASLGLKDPWLRNEVWRYDPKIWPLSENQRLMTFLFRGFKWGLLAAIITVGVDKALSSSDSHEHAHH